ncbi:preprotein translocase, YajC subunit [Thermoclostridium stercorarium subsp. stercorarium DSM 8532]|jgi:preprotein translocase subunit YajC|uniref:Preprotein translocase, YajC subunit n=4 Tax=Thermoclostridium stercorarium TaxID=1510 RepID=L7VNG1_THES1|nr:preprotein translocase, YajC subunit [Thermoclostridium stercorarium subsp. stercorarium DSM 8532]
MPFLQKHAYFYIIERRNNMNWLLTAFAESAANTAAEEVPEVSSFYLFLIQFGPLILMFVLMYFILIRPQRKKEKETREMINNAIVGDRVITIGGITGKIINIKDDEFTIESGNERTKITIKKWAVKEVIKPISE